MYLYSILYSISIASSILFLFYFYSISIVFLFYIYCIFLVPIYMHQQQYIDIYQDCRR